MSLSVTPATADQVATSSGVANSTTSFSPSAGSMVRICAAWMDATDQLGKTFTCADSHSNSYTATLAGGDADGGCYLLVFDHVYATAPGATTVTITAAGTGATATADCLIQPYVITGQAAAQSGAAHNSFSEAGTSTSTCEISLTTTQAGSAVFILGAPNNLSVPTAIAGTTTDHNWDDSGVGSHGVVGRASALTVTPGPTTFGWTLSPASAFGYGVMAAEVLPAVSPLTRVQHNSMTTTGTTGSSFSATLGSGVTAGNLLVATVTLGTNLTVTPPAGWTQAGPTEVVAGSLQQQLWYLVVASGGATSWTWSWTGSHSFGWTIDEWNSSTGWPASPVDSSAGAVHSTASTAVNCGSPAATAQASELWYGVLSWANSGQTLSGVTAGWTTGDSAVFTGQNTSTGFYQAAAATGTPSLAATISASTVNAGVVATFTPAAGSHTASASLTVTPAFSATRSHTQFRSASLTVTPVLSVSRTGSHPRTASLTVTPSLAAAGTGGPPVFLTSASLTVTPSFSAAAAATRFRSASLTVTPVLSAARLASHVAHASLTVTPTFSVTRAAAHVRTASLTVIPVLTAAAVHIGGAPPGYPDGNLGATVEFFNGTGWVDITDAALPDGQQYGSVKSGQADGSQQPTPAAMPATWDNPDYSLSPRNTAGPHFGQLRQNTPVRVSFNSPYGAYLRLEADDSDQAAVADTSALHITGSMEVRLGARLSDYRACVLAARQDTGGTPSWAWLLNANGTQTFKWWDSGGTLRSVTSDAVAAVSWLAYRVTLNASSGTVTFYVSTGIDGTWVQLGDAASGTSGSASSVRAGNCPLTVGWSAAASQQLCGQVYGLRLYSGIGGTIVADAGFPVVIPGSTSWTDAAGRTWGLFGGAEVTGRDYRGHFELASSQPAADVSSSLPRVAVQLSGRLRRLQQGSAPTADSAMKRAILSQAGSLIPVDYWTLEDGIVAKQFGAALGTQLLTANLGTVQAAADSSFEASAPLPQLNGDSLSATVDTYTGATAWTVRFLCKIGQLPAAATTQRLASVSLASGTVRRVDLIIDDTGGVGLKGFNSGGGSVFTTSEFGGFDVTNPKWFSIEGTASGGNTIFNAINLAPGATSGEQLGGTLPSTSGAPANVSSVTINPDLFFTDTAVGHLTVQKAWTTLFALGKPLNAWRTELTADRFARVCAEQGITCRILGRPSVTQAMGPQPRGSTWVILRDCANTEQSIIYEPYDVLGLCLRTRESMGAQAPGMTLSFADSDLPGDVQPADDDSGFLNDVTGQMPDGTTWRQVLDDGSAKSVSEPKDGGMGRYTGSVPFPLNVADAGELPSAVAFYLGRVSVDEQRFRNVTANFGIPGAPVVAAARLRPGDLIKITDVPALYQTADIEQLAMGRTEPFGPGRRISWDCIPWSPYSP